MRETAGWGRACAQGNQMVVHCPLRSSVIPASHCIRSALAQSAPAHCIRQNTVKIDFLTIFMQRMSKRKEREGGDDFNHRSCYYLSFLSILYFPQAECKLLITFGSSEGPERNHLASRATIRAFANSLRWNADYCNLHQYCTAPHRCTLTPTSGSGTTLT